MATGDKDVVLLAGTICEWQHPDTGVWAKAPSLTALGEIGDTSEAKEKTHLGNTSKRYGSGLRDAADQDLEGQYIPKQESGDEFYDDYVLQQAFLKTCKAESEFNFRINWPDGDVSGFLFKSLGFMYQSGTQEDWKMFTVPGKQNSRMIYGVEVTGTAAVAAAVTTQLGLDLDPGNLIEADYEGEVVWSSSDESIATVDDEGLVTGVLAGTATITATVRGVPGTLEVTVS